MTELGAAPPWGLLAEAKRAWWAAAAAVGERLLRERAAVDRYARLVNLAARLHRQWASAGYPATTDGGASGKATVAHPLLAEIRSAEKAAAEAGAALGLDEASASKILTRGTGTPRRGSHVVAPEAPSARLRSVE